MQIIEEFPQLEAILADWKSIIGKDYNGYRHHLYRMINICFALHPCDEEQQRKVFIAAAFHDIGIWTDHTVDYIPPSIPPALHYLQEHGLQAWAEEISLMISEHHKVRAYTDPRYPLVEQFRQADLVDFSLGAVRFGLDKYFINELKRRFPNAGFHKNLAQLGGKWFLKHPLNPLPMMKW